MMTNRCRIRAAKILSLLLVSVSAMLPAVRQCLAAEKPDQSVSASSRRKAARPDAARDPQSDLSNKTNSADEPLPEGARVRLGSTHWRHKSDVAVGRFSPDGTILATGGSGDTIYLWNVETGQQIRELTGTGRWQIYGLVFSPDGKKLTSIQQSGVIRSWNVEIGNQVGDSQKHSGDAYERYGLACSPDGKIIADGKTLASGMDRGTTLLWDISSIQTPR